MDILKFCSYIGQSDFFELYCVGKRTNLSYIFVENFLMHLFAPSQHKKKMSDFYIKTYRPSPLTGRELARIKCNKKIRRTLIKKLIIY